MKILVSKQMSQDESFQLSLEGKDATDIRGKLRDAVTLLDERLLQQSMRVVDAMKETEGLPPAVRQCINATMGVLFGRPGAMQEMAVAKEFLAKSQRLDQGELRVVPEFDPDPDAAVSE